MALTTQSYQIFQTESRMEYTELACLFRFKSGETRWVPKDWFTINKKGIKVKAKWINEMEKIGFTKRTKR